MSLANEQFDAGGIDHEIGSTERFISGCNDHRLLRLDLIRSPLHSVR
jgi:hypothetical protein